MYYFGWPNKLGAGLAIALLSGHGTQAQIQTAATCDASFGYMNNSLNQSPCLVAAYLQGACFSGVWTVPALPHRADGQQLAYLAPDSSALSLCTCSWAVYNLMAACGGCQGEAWVTWSNYSAPCVTSNLVSNQPFPQQIPVPPETAIPEYAGKDPATWTGTRGFNVTEAKNIGSHNIQISTSGSSSATATAPNTSDTSPPSYSGGPPVGPIVGGVVGGLLGLLLIAVLATFLLCPARFRRRDNIRETHSSVKQEGIPAAPSSHTPPGMRPVPYDMANVPMSHQQLLPSATTRPPLAPRLTSSVYSFSTADQSVTSSMALQPVQQANAGPILYHPPPESIINPTPSPPSSFPEAPNSSVRTSASVRSFFTRATPRHGHAHTPSDTSVTSASSLLPRIQQGLRLGQSAAANDVVVPYVITPSTSNQTSSPPTSFASSSSMAASQPQFPVDRKMRPTGLQYTPPPAAHSALSEPSGSDGSTIGMEQPMQPPNAFRAASTMETAYGMVPSDIITGGEIEADRQTNMSPANASSILEAAPPYATDEHDGGGFGRGGMPLRRTPRLPDVDEYPEEKARFTNAAGERPM